MTVENKEKYTATVRVDRSGTEGISISVTQLKEPLTQRDLIDALNRIVEETKHGWQRMGIFIERELDQSKSNGKIKPSA